MGFSYSKLNIDESASWPTEEQLEYLTIMSAQGATQEDAIEALAYLCVAKGVDPPAEHITLGRHYCGMIDKSIYTNRCCCLDGAHEEVYNPVFMSKFEEQWVATVYVVA